MKRAILITSVLSLLCGCSSLFHFSGEVDQHEWRAWLHETERTQREREFAAMTPEMQRKEIARRDWERAYDRERELQQLQKIHAEQEEAVRVGTASACP